MNPAVFSAKRILITGAAGNIGSKLVLAFKDEYELVLLDRRGGSGIIGAELAEYDRSWVKRFKGVDAVVHLAANPREDAPWSELVRDNLDAVLNVCHAASEMNVARVILASSCHTMGGYHTKSLVQTLTPDMKPLPDGPYGAGKLVAERICRSFAEKGSFSCICLRIGWVPRQEVKAVTDSWLRSLWLSERDLVQIVREAIEVQGVRYAILFAVSDNRESMWDLEPTRETLNYEPQDGLK